jgi:hypothetical protein
MSFIEASILVTLSGTQVWRLRYYAGIVKLLLSPAKGGGLPDGNYERKVESLREAGMMKETYEHYLEEQLFPTQTLIQRLVEHIEANDIPAVQRAIQHLEQGLSGHRVTIAEVERKVIHILD